MDFVNENDQNLLKVLIHKSVKSGSTKTNWNYGKLSNTVTSKILNTYQQLTYVQIYNSNTGSIYTITTALPLHPQNFCGSKFISGKRDIPKDRNMEHVSTYVYALVIIYYSKEKKQCTVVLVKITVLRESN